MGLALDGLASGLDTKALITSLMQLEAIPQSLLKTKVSNTQSAITALQSLNTKISSLGDLANKAAKPDALAVFAATSSSDKISVRAAQGATPGQLEIFVEKLAQAQTTVSDTVTAWPESVLTITGSDGKPMTVTAASTALDDVVQAVNAAKAGVTATKVAAGKDSSTGEPQYRLQFIGSETGATGAFSISGTAVGLTTIKAAQDAEATLWKGTSAEQLLTSPTNTFTDILSGVSVTASAVSTDPVSISVKRDAAAATKVAQDFVGSLNEVFALISVKSVVTTTTTNGETSVNGGVFTGDSAVRSARQSLLSAASMPVNGFSPSEIGISITKTGVLEFDADKFKTALSENPTKVESMIHELGSRVAGVASQTSDKYNGTLTSKITGQESLAKNLNGQIEEWDTRLENRRATLSRTYSAMEVRLSALNAQSSYLTSQLASLNPGNSQK
ncbi:flagellar hook-associated protein 2 [Okibacterium sp. HSC-33S16]|uniref:flagellar filament capping protein FliD n=1 Tax=Okibacterium sp. HSC-33S16 TaxID=2910965 RepID=UPI0020A218C0|nr:flagellar filament capping protein FliD [Okibacterium sp. HSC-33S16]MCP2032919.1 flagellar hook-associated protein 2 [Okibacterium sp. HSC-33S16]